jgi:hypothetical protein
MFKYKFYEYRNNEKDCPIIKCVSSYEGKSVTATAELHPGDEYDYETGKEIARLRCEKKLLDKKSKRFLRKKKAILKAIADLEACLAKLKKRADAYGKTAAKANEKAADNSNKLDELIKKYED